MAKNHPTKAAYICAKVVFDFFNNDDEIFKQKTLKDLTKNLRKEFNLSAITVDDNIFQNPERGSIAISFTAVSLEQGAQILDKIMLYLDSNCPARIIDECIIKEEFP